MTHNWEYKVYRNLRLLLRCSFKGCKETRKLHFAHIDWTPIVPYGKGRGKQDRILDLLKYPQCYLPFCKWHHKIIDGGQTWKSGKTKITIIKEIRTNYGLQSPLRNFAIRKIKSSKLSDPK